MMAKEHRDVSSSSSSSSSKDLFLTGEERFQVWEVKAAERPHLLAACEEDEENESNDNDKHDDSTVCSTTLLPLMDGCDIPGWRRARIGYNTATSDVLYGALCIGQGCALMRRETQLPVLSTRMTAQRDWKALQAKLLNVPPPPHPHDDGGEGTMMIKMIPRISYKDHKNSVLHAWFERKNVPVLLEGCMSDWPAMKTCTWDALVHEFGDYKWRFSDTHGETMSLKTYDKYVKSLEGLTDDSPLAIYDSQFHTDDRKCLLQDYQVPSCFDTDLFALLDNKDEKDINRDKEDDSGDEEDEATAVIVERPPYRWILMGPERSGTGLHVDPVGTHAWVSLIQGCKRWVLFPPDTCRKTIGMLQEHQIPSVLWFRDYYEKVCLPPTPPTTSCDGGGRESTSNNGTTFVPGAVHVVQRPGETVYVPAGWPHLVLNLEASVAITENYATEYPSMDRLWRAVEEAEPALAVRFREVLEKHRPDLAQINNDDADDAVVGNNEPLSCVSSAMPTNHGILKTCGEQEGTSQSENKRCNGCRIVD